MINRGTPAPFFKSFNRPILILGVERSLFFLLIGLSLPIAFSGHLAPIMDLIAILIFLIGYTAGLLLTRVDPQMLILYRRFIHYHSYYCGQPKILGKTISCSISVPL